MPAKMARSTSRPGSLIRLGVERRRRVLFVRGFLTIAVAPMRSRLPPEFRSSRRGPGACIRSDYYSACAVIERSKKFIEQPSMGTAVRVPTLAGAAAALRSDHRDHAVERRF